VLTLGGSTTVFGAGFASHESVVIYLDDPNTPADELTTAMTDANGNVPATSITIPAATATGAHTLYAEGFTSHGEGSAIVQVVVAGSLTFSPAGAPAGSQTSPSFSSARATASSTSPSSLSLPAFASRPSPRRLAPRLTSSPASASAPDPYIKTSGPW